METQWLRSTVMETLKFKMLVGLLIAIANAIRNMGALLVLSMNSNHLGVDGGKALAEGLKGNNAITELNIADNDLTYYGEDISGIIILARAHNGRI
jgi:hypothetical protein